MPRVKKRLSIGILIFAMFFTIAAVSIPATATNGKESSEVSGIKLEPPSQYVPEAYGKAIIEEYFPVTDNSDAVKGGSDVNLAADEFQRENNQELPIIYEQQEGKEASESNISAPEDVDSSWNYLRLLLIPIIIVVMLLAVIRIKRLKKKRRFEL